MTNVSLRPTENDSGFPALWVDIRRNDESAGSVYGRFPERLDARSSAGESLRLYKDNRSPEWPANLACEPVSMPVTWRTTDTSAGFDLEFDNRLCLSADATVTGNTIDFRYVLNNETGQDLERIRLDICVQGLHVPEINDPSSDRTGFPVRRGFKRVRELIPEFATSTSAATNGHRFYGYPLGTDEEATNPAITPHPGHPEDPSRAIYRWTAPGKIERPSIAIESKDGTWSIATSSATSARVWNNPALSCMHSSPEAESCRAEESIVMTNTVTVHEGGLSSIEVSR